MDGRLLTRAEEILRKYFSLSEAYSLISCSITKSNIVAEFDNDLISVKIKMPRNIVEDKLEEEDYKNSEPETTEEPMSDESISSDGDDSDVSEGKEKGKGNKKIKKKKKK